MCFVGSDTSQRIQQISDHVVLRSVTSTWEVQQVVFTSSTRYHLTPTQWALHIWPVLWWMPGRWGCFPDPVKTSVQPSQGGSMRTFPLCLNTPTPSEHLHQHRNATHHLQKKSQKSCNSTNAFRWFIILKQAKKSLLIFHVQYLKTFFIHSCKHTERPQHDTIHCYNTPTASLYREQEHQTMHVFTPTHWVGLLGVNQRPFAFVTGWLTLQHTRTNVEILLYRLKMGKKKEETSEHSFKSPTLMS